MSVLWEDFNGYKQNYAKYYIFPNWTWRSHWSYTLGGKHPLKEDWSDWSVNIFIDTFIQNFLPKEWPKTFLEDNH